MKNILLLISAFIYANCFAQLSIKGTVTDKETHEPIVAASVLCSELNKATRTDDKGNFEFTNLAKGNYNIQVSFIGYQTFLEAVALKDSSRTLNISLGKSFIEINEVVISGAYQTSQDESPQEIDVVKKSEMQQTGASTVMDVISKVSGVNAITTGPLVSRPVIRGLSGNRILTVVDGVRYETQQWDDEHGIGINELGMDRIEIIKGPASLLYGPEAMGGVVHFIEEQPSATGHISGEAHGGMYSNNMGYSAGASAKGASEKNNWNVSGLWKSLPDYYFNGYSFRAPNTRMNEIGAKASDGFNGKWGSSKLSYQFNQAYYGILDGKDIVKHPDGSITNKDTTEKDMFPSELEAPYHSVTDNKITSQTNLIAGASHFKITLGFQNNHRIENEDDGKTKTGYKYVDMTLQSIPYDVKWFLPTWKNFSTILGVQGMYEMNKNFSAAKTILVPDATINDLGFVALTKYHLKKFNFTAGARYDSRNLSTTAMQKDSTVNMPSISRSYNNISGAIGATYDIEEHLLLRANYATGYRSPNLNELMSNGVKLESQHYEIGSIDFTKEQNNEIDLSAVFKTKHFSIEAGVYQNNISNFIFLAPTSDSVITNLSGGKKVPIYRFNQKNAQLKGGEAGIDIHPQAISWVHLEVKAATLSAMRTDSNLYLPMMPTDKIYTTLYFNFNNCKKFKNVFTRLGTVYAFDMKNVARNELTTPGYTLLNFSVGASRKIWKLDEIDFILAVNNALDVQYFDNLSHLRPYGVYNPGRNIVLSLRIPFDVKKK